jgi:hypothetical protein
VIAFMKYDLFPYVVWGEVVEDSRKDGTVNVKGYGCYSLNSVKFILPQERGVQLAKEVRQLTKEYDNAKEALHKKYTDKLNNLMAWKEM